MRMLGGSGKEARGGGGDVAWMKDGDIVFKNAGASDVKFKRSHF